METVQTKQEYLKEYYIKNRDDLSSKAKDKYATDEAYKRATKDKVLARRLAQNKERYGVERPSNEQIMAYKRAQRLLKQSPTSSLLEKDFLYEQHVTLRKTLTQIGKECGNISQQAVAYWCDYHGIEIQRNYRSSTENELAEWLQAQGVECLLNDRKLIGPYELDIVIPSHKLAIEFNGLYWHSHSIKQDRLYHQRKALKVHEAGYSLITVWDTEWMDKSELIKSMILSRLGKNRTVFARKLTIEEVDKKTLNAWLEENHVQGGGTFNVGYALKEGDTILMAATFCKSRFDKTVEWELHRLASLQGVTVVGGASRLIQHFNNVHNFPPLLSYCDLRFGYGNVYQQLGFEFVSVTDPNYFYFKTRKNWYEIKSRQQMMKHKLEKVLPIFDPELSEYDNCLANSFDKVYDCGNTKWLLNKK